MHQRPSSTASRYARYDSGLGVAPQSWVEVMPRRRNIFSSVASPSFKSVSEPWGKALRIEVTSRRTPVRSPVWGSRSMTPPSGSGVSCPMPKRPSARVLATQAWPPRMVRITGLWGATRSSSWRVARRRARGAPLDLAQQRLDRRRQLRGQVELVQPVAELAHEDVVRVGIDEARRHGL